jgi:hypothetical protein
MNGAAANGPTARPAVQALESHVAAQARRTTITWAELDRHLFDRYALTDDGRSALAHLVRSKLLVQLERETGIEVRPEEVDVRWLLVDEGVRASGEAGIESQLKKTRLSVEEFRRYLRLSIVHERLTRRALGLDDDEPVTGEQQEMWLDQVMTERGCADVVLGATEAPEELADRAIVRCAGLEVTQAEYLPHLRRGLSPEDVRRACYQLLLDKRMTARMPDLAPEALDAAITQEIERRRVTAESDPKHQGISFEKLLEAQGIRLSTLQRDPGIRVTVLSRLWIERSYDEDALKEIYANERDFFDGTYGEAVELGVIFLRAARFPNELNPRSYAEASRELTELGKTVRTASEFRRMAAKHSDVPSAREDKGMVGFVTRLDRRISEELRAAAFERLAQRTSLDPPAAERLVGPLEVATGCILLWLGERRSAPTWERMAIHVRTELRRRDIEDEVLPEESVVTWMDLE